MRRFNLLFALLAFLAATPVFAQGATLALPSVVVTGPSSTSIACNQVAGTAASPLVAPVAAGTVLFQCTVQPTNWVGAASVAGGSPFGITPPNGNTFNITFATAVTAPGTYSPISTSTLP